jgi:hypothetical protein
MAGVYSIGLNYLVPYQVTDETVQTKLAKLLVPGLKDYEQRVWGGKKGIFGTGTSPAPKF